MQRPDEGTKRLYVNNGLEKVLINKVPDISLAHFIYKYFKKDMAKEY